MAFTTAFKTNAELVRGLRETTGKRADADRRAAGWAQEQADSIRTALTAGVSVVEIAALTGLSRARIYQIRDGRR